MSESFKITTESLQHESKVQEQKILRNITESKYPLSDSGCALKERIQSGKATKEEIPTVENPRSELFAELNIAPERAEEVFGFELGNIQITKGCTHDCEFCCVSAMKKVDVMPFPAVLKLAEMKKKGEEAIETHWQSWVTELKKLSGVDIAQFEDNTEISASYGEEAQKAIRKSMLTQHSMHESNQLLLDALESNPIAKIVEFRRGKSIANIRDDIKEANEEREISVVHYKTFPLRKKNIEMPITNYYDSDPFDYKDRSFLHADGTPADFGDVVQKLASFVRPIHITTAGWSTQDKIAQRAAEKVAFLKGKGLLCNLRLSINPTEVRARKDLDKYLADMVNNIITLADTHPVILIFGDRQFQDRVFAFLQEKLTQEILKKVRLELSQISTFSGRANEQAEAFPDSRDDHDVASCMPGYHIWPNGAIAKQEYELDYRGNPTSSFTIRKGSRPTVTSDAKLW